MYPLKQESLNIVEALKKHHLDVHTPYGIRTLRRKAASQGWTVAEESYLLLSSMKGYDIFESSRKPTRQAVPA